MKHLLGLLGLISATAMAAPTLSADPVPATAAQPATAEWQISGAATWSACALTGSPKAMACDLASITVPGNYTLLARFTYAAGCDAAGTCWGAGSAVSSPFAYVWKGAGASPPTVLRVAP